MLSRKIHSTDITSLFSVRTSTRENTFTLEELHAVGITEDSVAAMLETTHKGWLCEIDGKVVGFSIGDTITGELWVIAVLPEAEGRGVGSRLLQLTEETLADAGHAELWLETSADRSLRAYAFYRSKGWQEADIVEDSLRMTKTVLR